MSETNPPYLLRDLLETIADRPGQSETRRTARAQGALGLIQEFAPKDGVEVMLAGQAVLFLSLVLDAARDSHHATTADAAYKHRQQAMALSRAQLSCIRQLREHRSQSTPKKTPASPPEAAPTPEPKPPAPAGQPPANPPTRHPVQARPAFGHQVAARVPEILDS